MSLGTIIGLYGKSSTADVTSYQYTRHMQNILDVSKDSGALDNSQLFVTASWETDDDYWVMYTGQSAASIVYAPDGRTYQNTDQGFLASLPKSNTVNTGWTKLVDVNGDPKPVFGPSVGPTVWDNLQVWPRSIIKEGSTLKLWYLGEKNEEQIHRVGYATSSDNGLTWTKYVSNPVYTDTDVLNDRILVCKVVHNGTNYIMFYSPEDPTTEGLFVAQSADGISWTKIHSNLLVDQFVNYLNEAKYIGGQYYVWIQRASTSGQIGNGPSPRVSLYRSSNLTTWENLGVQLLHRGSHEWAIGADGALFQKPNGNYFFIHNYFKNALEVFANSGEQFMGTKVAELNRSDLPIANKPCVYAYPSYVQRHYPLGPDFYSALKFTEVINNDQGTINSIPAFAGLHFVNLNGSQTITCPGISINQTTFGVKIRVLIKTTGTHELFKIGDDVLITLESGKLRVRLSSDGAGYEKDYITTVDISEPSGIDYPDNHVYVGFTFIGGALTMYNDFVPFTAGQITGTVDDALASINNSQSNILIGQNATIELRSVSILNGATDQQFIDLDI